MVRQVDSGGRHCSIPCMLRNNVIFFQDEVRLTAPCATPKPINLEECILCQKRSDLSTSPVVKLVGAVLFRLPNKQRATTLEPSTDSARARHHEIPHLNLLQKFSKGYG